MYVKSFSKVQLEVSVVKCSTRSSAVADTHGSCYNKVSDSATLAEPKCNAEYVVRRCYFIELSVCGILYVVRLGYVVPADTLNCFKSRLGK